MKDIDRIGSAKNYQAALNVFKGFLGNRDISFDELTYSLIVRFEEYLVLKSQKINSIASYMKVLRALCNLAIKENSAKQELYPFNHYQIKEEKTKKRAISKANIVALKELNQDDMPDLQAAQDYFLFSFYCRGMSFVDLAHLKKSSVVDGRIDYARHKTNQKFSIKITPHIQSIIDRRCDPNEKNEYVFPIINSEKNNQYQQYRNGLNLISTKLNIIDNMIGLSIPLTTYISRHSWATIAKRQGISTAIISEGLGHETERTTQIYLDSFENQVLDDANELITNI